VFQMRVFVSSKYVQQWNDGFGSSVWEVDTGTVGVCVMPIPHLLLISYAHCSTSHTEL